MTPAAHLTVEQLEALARDPGAAAPDAAAHLAACPACAGELAWLRTERALAARRAAAQPPLSPALWEAVSARIATPQVPSVAPLREVPAPPRREPDAPTLAPAPALSPPPAQRRSRSRWSWAVTAAAAAAALALALRPGHGPNSLGLSASNSLDASVARADEGQDVKAALALDRAEGDCRDAARVLEAEYEEEKRNLDPAVALRWDKSLSRVRSQLDGARAVAGNDVDARMRVLDGYARYLQSLRRVVDASEEAR